MNNELSPLDQIRNTEAEITRKIAAAQEKSKQKIAQAQREAQELLKMAKDKGYLHGQVRGKEILAKTEVEAKAIVEKANKQAENFRARGQKQMGVVVQFAMEFILGVEGVNEDT